MSSSQTKELSSLLSAATNATRGGKHGRFVDIGVEIRVVAADPRGRELLRGKPRLRVVRRHRFGGRWDSKLRRFAGPPSRWLVWHVSERQESVLLDEGETETRTLLYSAEGGGKTVTGAMWAVVQVIRLAMAGVFVAGGATAPTHERLQTLVKAICERIPTDTPRVRREGSWATYYADQREIRFVTGHVIQCRSTKRASAATGSPVQGFTWAFSLDDELQDSVENEADPDIEARLRGVKVSRRLGTATAKDSPRWRSFRDEKNATKDWKIERIQFHENPFVWPEHWDRMRRNMSKREWDRRGLALDVGPERMLYVSWERARNLRPVPQVGAEDITEQVLAGSGGSFSMLVGHDPGKLFDVSIFLKAYRLPSIAKPVWWVVDELTTANTTTEQHVAALLKRLGERWHLNEADWRGQRNAYGKRALVRADPQSHTASDTAPGRDVYAVFRQAGLTILSAAYRTTGTVSKSTPIAKEARIEVVNTLLCNAAGESRLFVACDERRQPCAPKLVESLELSERDEGGKAENANKDINDLTHWSAGLGYGLYPYERPRMTQTMVGHG